jgi:murein DD-endopeptidase MepM/ murein hydrolase activator NlpD
MPKASYKETNIKRSRTFSFKTKAVLAIIATVVVFAAQSSTHIFAADVSDLRQQQQQKTQRLTELNNSIKNYQGQITQLSKQTNTLQNQIAIFNAQINQAQAQVEATQTSIDLATSQINDLTGQIGDKESHISETKIQLAAMMRELNEMDGVNNTLLTLMNNDNLSDFIDAMSQVQNLQGKSYELLQTIKTLKVELEDNRSDVQKRKDQLKDYQQDLQDQQDALSDQISQKNQLLAVTRGQESNYRKLLSNSQNEEDKVQKEINDLENQIRAQLGQLASPGKKGLFVWPIAGGVLTQGYGNTGFTSLGYTFHNGYDIASIPGSPILSVADGTVYATGAADPTNTKAYGNWVVTKHSLANGRQVYVLYGHMRRISVQAGQQVKAGQVLGAEGNTGNTTRLIRGGESGYHTHLTVFDVQGFRIVNYGSYQVPAGYTYNPGEFF